VLRVKGSETRQEIATPTATRQSCLMDLQRGTLQRLDPRPHTDWCQPRTDRSRHQFISFSAGLL